MYCMYSMCNNLCIIIHVCTVIQYVCICALYECMYDKFSYVYLCIYIIFVFITYSLVVYRVLSVDVLGQRGTNDNSYQMILNL